MSNYNPLPKPGWFTTARGEQTWWTGRNWSAYRRAIPVRRRSRAAVWGELPITLLLPFITLGTFRPTRYWASRLRR